jgi:hypothetical protein
MLPVELAPPAVVRDVGAPQPLAVAPGVVHHDHLGPVAQRAAVVQPPVGEVDVLRRHDEALVEPTEIEQPGPSDRHVVRAEHPRVALAAELDRVRVVPDRRNAFRGAVRDDPAGHDLIGVRAHQAARLAHPLRRDRAVVVCDQDRLLAGGGHPLVRGQCDAAPGRSQHAHACVREVPDELVDPIRALVDNQYLLRPRPACDD